MKALVHRGVGSCVWLDEPTTTTTDPEAAFMPIGAVPVRLRPVSLRRRRTEGPRHQAEDAGRPTGALIPAPRSGKLPVTTLHPDAGN